MACVRNTLVIFAALLLIYQKTATCDFLSPLLSPVFDNICQEVECGKGKCKPSSNTTFMYECECENGWKQFDHHLKFLPCVTPNCTFDLTCGEAASPSQPKTPPKDNNASIFEACHWVDCGGGFCNSTMPFSYSCDCREGYRNLMNITTLPCFKECALGMDCLNLGIPLSNASSSSPPALPDSSKNQAPRLNVGGSSLLWMTSLLCVSIAPWRVLYV
ncbi:hypothetical protein EUTSA_v10026216mg [Eutrema salsugineum]|uniref:EGF-like domain-containing protein n=2 Tax=Eutrema salsugineum TaxID=72664 RepID=V4P8Z5_EUTSA|nr:uncharacterized protein LOC18028740 isoform X2 [Eutrema salsugineum]ESQ56101.1 hypothetical protein EUTSA_v10026216mg [Eutrema salsugineum]